MPSSSSRSRELSAHKIKNKKAPIVVLSAALCPVKRKRKRKKRGETTEIAKLRVWRGPLSGSKDQWKIVRGQNTGSYTSISNSNTQDTCVWPNFKVTEGLAGKRSTLRKNKYLRFIIGIQSKDLQFGTLTWLDQITTLKVCVFSIEKSQIFFVCKKTVW